MQQVNHASGAEAVSRGERFEKSWRKRRNVGGDVSRLMVAHEQGSIIAQNQTTPPPGIADARMTATGFHRVLRTKNEQVAEVTAMSD